MVWTRAKPCDKMTAPSQGHAGAWQLDIEKQAQGECNQNWRLADATWCGQCVLQVPVVEKSVTCMSDQQSTLVGARDQTKTRVILNENPSTNQWSSDDQQTTPLHSGK